MELLLAIFLAVLTGIVAIAFYYEHPKAEIPHGISERQKLYALHYCMNFGIGLSEQLNDVCDLSSLLQPVTLLLSDLKRAATFVLICLSIYLNNFLICESCHNRARRHFRDRVREATFLNKVGIISEVHLLRIITETIPTFKDKRLLIKDLRFERVKVRIYQPKTSNNSQRRGILYFHGGVGQWGSIRIYERMCCYLCRKTNSVVVCVGYRLAPEHPFPAQFEDCLTAAVHFLRTAQDHGVDPSRIVICGDSSGGTLTAAVAQALVNRRDLPKLRAQILIYPFLQCVDFNLPSYQQNERVPILPKERTVAFGLKYLNEDLWLKELFKGCHVSEDRRLKYQKWVNPDYIPLEFKTRGYKPSPVYPPSKQICEVLKSMFDPVFSPLLAEDSVIARLPETFILTCEFDVLRDDGLLYKKRLEDHGIKVTWCHLQEGFHGTVFLALFGRVIGFRSGTKGLEKIVNFLRLM